MYVQDKLGESLIRDVVDPPTKSQGVKVRIREWSSGQGHLGQSKFLTMVAGETE